MSGNGWNPFVVQNASLKLSNHCRKLWHRMKLGKTAGSQSQLLNSWDSSLATGLTISWFYVVELETGVEK